MNFRRRVRISKRKIQCSQNGCRVIAVRFIDAPQQLRQWFCRLHFDQQQKEISDVT